MESKREKNKRYFTSETQAAIIKYNTCDDKVIREQLYREHIDYPFNKLAEILIHKGKFYYAGPNMTEIKAEVIWHLLEKLNNYTETKGRAYSYFTVVAWRFLINLNNTNYQKIKNRSTDEFDNDSNDISLSYDTEQSIDREKFFDEFTIYMDENLARFFPRKKEMDIANAVLEIIKRRYNIENFNKKALYIYIREMTNCKSSQITSIVSSMKIIYEKAWDDYMNNGCLSYMKIYK